MRVVSWCRRWQLWNLPLPALLYLGVLHSAAAAVVAWALSRCDVPATAQLLLLLLATAAFIEARVRVALQRTRTVVPGMFLQNVTPVVDETLAHGHCVDPAARAGVVWTVVKEVLANTVHWVGSRRAPHIWREARPGSRAAFNTSRAALSLAVAGLVFHRVARTQDGTAVHLLAAVLGALAYEVALDISLGLILWLSAHIDRVHYVGGRAKTIVNELSEMCLAIFVWLAWGRTHWSVLLTLPILASFRKALPYASLLEQSRTDLKTGAQCHALEGSRGIHVRASPARQGARRGHDRSRPFQADQRDLRALGGGRGPAGGLSTHPRGRTAE